MSRLYHVVVINRKTGKRVQMTGEPVTHSEGCVLLSKLTRYSWRIETLEQL